MNSTFQIYTYNGDPNTVFNNNLFEPSSIEKKGILIPFIDTKNKKMRLVSIDCLHSIPATDVPTPLLSSFFSPQLFNSNGVQSKIYFTSNGVTSFNENFYLNKNILNNQNIEFVLENLDINLSGNFINNFKYFLMNIEIV